MKHLWPPWAPSLYWMLRVAGSQDHSRDWHLLQFRSGWGHLRLASPLLSTTVHLSPYIVLHSTTIHYTYADQPPVPYRHSAFHSLPSLLCPHAPSEHRHQSHLDLTYSNIGCYVIWYSESCYVLSNRWTSAQMNRKQRTSWSNMLLPANVLIFILTFWIRDWKYLHIIPYLIVSVHVISWEDFIISCLHDHKTFGKHLSELKYTDLVLNILYYSNNIQYWILWYTKLKILLS